MNNISEFFLIMYHTTTPWRMTWRPCDNLIMKRHLGAAATWRGIRRPSRSTEYEGALTWQQRRSKWQKQNGRQTNTSSANGLRRRELTELVLAGPDKNKWAETHIAAQFFICIDQLGRYMVRAWVWSNILSEADKKKTPVLFKMFEVKSLAACPPIDIAVVRIK